MRLLNIYIYIREFGLEKGSRISIISIQSKVRHFFLLEIYFERINNGNR